MTKVATHFKQLVLMLVGLCWLSGCHDDFLDRTSEDTPILEEFYATEDQLISSSALLYGNSWFGFNDKASWIIGESMSGNHWADEEHAVEFFTLSVKGDNPHLSTAWASLWGVIARANTIIVNVPLQIGHDVSADVAERVIGEALFMRAAAYFYLVRLWGGVPIIEDNAAQIDDPIVPRHRVEDVYQFIINDLKRAVAVLPFSYPPEEAGRATTWSAEAMLAKVYLARAGYGRSGDRDPNDLAAAARSARRVLNQSGKFLLADYDELFRVQNENNEESLFALQWVSCRDWGSQNTHQAYFAESGAITGLEDGWGGYQGPSIDLQNAYEPNDRRKDATVMTDGAFYPELMRETGGYTYRVIRGDDDGENATFAAVKKYVIGSTADNPGVQICYMSTPLNTYVQRLSDVYLILAEALLGNRASTSDPEALNAINTVRQRAGLSRLSAISLEDILQERRIEFAYESDYWYDLVRIHYFDPHRAEDMLARQERGRRSFDYQGRWIVTSRQIAPDRGDFLLPYPTEEVNRNPLLEEAPVSYDF